MKVYDRETDTIRESTDVMAVNRLYKLREKYKYNVWPVIDEILNIWHSKNPKQWDAYLVRIQDIKRTRKDKKFASTYDKVHGGYLRYTLDIPQKVISMIRFLYSPDELKMDRNFFIKFARRFPRMKIAEKL